MTRAVVEVTATRAATGPVSTALHQQSRCRGDQKNRNNSKATVVVAMVARAARAGAETRKQQQSSDMGKKQ